jgi:hypothetical protein
MTARFQVLSGLPPYGPLPKQFPSGSGRYREGFVVEFQNENDVWIGNFIGGATRFSSVFDHLDGPSVIVIAGGQGYVVDVNSQDVSSAFGGSLTGIVDSGVHRFVFSTFTTFEAYGSTGLMWQTRRLSWDGQNASPLTPLRSTRPAYHLSMLFQ